jgi:glucose uptake protein
MILPTTALTALLLVVLSMICWGSWANTYKLAGRWRFELYYYDFTLGLALFCVIAAFTLGSLNSSELTFQDNLLLTGYRKMAFGFASGVVFNLANILLLGAAVVAGLAVSFPVVMGVAAILFAAWNYISDPRGNALLLFGGMALVLVAVVLDLIAHAWRAEERALAAQKASIAESRTKAPPAAAGAARAVILGIAGGVFLALFYFAMAQARSEDNALASYTALLFFSAGVFSSTILYVPFFINFPVQGAPLPVVAYLKGTKKQHLLGLLGGAMLAGGILAAEVIQDAAPAVRPGTSAGWSIAQAAPILALLWGVLAWGEFRGTGDRVRMLIWGVFVLYAAGVGLMALGRM